MSKTNIKLHSFAAYQFLSLIAVSDKMYLNESEVPFLHMRKWRNEEAKR